MPTYEYECQKCGDLFDKFQNMSDPLLKKCPKCRGKVKRLLGAGAGIIFKGSGFYETDYRRKSGGSGSGNSGKTSKTSSDSSSDSKPVDSKSSDSKPSDSKPADSKSKTTSTRKN